MIGEKRGVGALDQGLEAFELLAVHAVGRAEIEGDAMLDDLVLFENLVQDVQRPAGVAHVVFGDDLEPIDGGLLAEDMA